MRKESPSRPAGGIRLSSFPLDVDKLQQALLNFIKNAMESMETNRVR